MTGSLGPGRGFLASANSMIVRKDLLMILQDKAEGKSHKKQRKGKGKEKIIGDLFFKLIPHLLPQGG